MPPPGKALTAAITGLRCSRLPRTCAFRPPESVELRCCLRSVFLNISHELASPVTTIAPTLASLDASEGLGDSQHQPVHTALS
jgi:hypothetical protein